MPAALGARHSAYLHAFRQLNVYRGVLHSNMSRKQVGLEVLYGNHSAANAVLACISVLALLTSLVCSFIVLVRTSVLCTLIVSCTVVMEACLSPSLPLAVH